MILEQEITQGKRFIITGYGVLANVPNNIKNGLEKVLQSIVSSFEIENGAFILKLDLLKTVGSSSKSIHESLVGL